MVTLEDMVFVAAGVAAAGRALMPKGLRWTLAALLLGGSVVPAAVVYTEFFLPYQGGGASMWPIAVVLGGFQSFIAGTVGVGAVELFWLLRRR